jgi:hypothetical protein
VRCWPRFTTRMDLRAELPSLRLSLLMIKDVKCIQIWAVK